MKLRQVSALITANLLLSASIGFAQDVTELEPYSDNWIDNVPVSGSIFKGYTVHSQHTLPSINEVWIHFGTKHKGTFCLKIESRDGKYLGQGLFNKIRLDAHAVRVPIKTKNSKRLKNIETTDIAALAFSADSCQERPKKLLAVSWTREISNDYLVSLNSIAGQAKIRVRDRNERSLIMTCSPAPAPHNVSFDSHCKIKDFLPETMDVSIMYGTTYPKPYHFIIQ